MVALSDVQIGSIVLGMIENVPSYISGAVLWSAVDNEIYNAENTIGDSIGTTSIAEKYQPAIVSLTAAAVLRMMELQGSDASSIRLGDFSISKGQGSSSMATAQDFRIAGLEALDKLGVKVNYYKTI
jgi:hypothetical protein